MLAYTLRRIGIMIPTLFVISIISFVVIQLPPGDFLTSYAASMRQQGEYIEQDALDALRDRYGFGQPVYVQYGKWVWGIISRGDWGQSMEWQKPVNDLIWERMVLTIILSLFSLFTATPLKVGSGP